MTLNLDQPETFAALDPNDTLGRIEELPEQLAIAWERAMAFKLPRTYRFAKRIVFLGMGGSAIGADFTRVLLGMQSKASAEVVRDYDLPAYVDDRTLVVVCSYSGSTEETLSATRQALERGARMIAATTGGELAALAREHKFPQYTIEYRSNPRSAFAHTFMPLLAFMQQLGFIDSVEQHVAEAVAVCAQLRDRLRPSVPQADNEAKQIAAWLHGRLPIVMAGSFLSVVASRWKAQLNENSKSWAYADTMPELNHNTVVGFPLPAEIRDAVGVVWLRSPHLHARILARYDITSEIMDREQIAHRTVEGRGASALSQMLSLVVIGDFVSFYLAMANGVDPHSIDNINYLKNALMAL